MPFSSSNSNLAPEGNMTLKPRSSSESLPGLAAWVFHLGPDGRVQSCRCEGDWQTALGEGGDPPKTHGWGDQWLGKSLAEVIQFSADSPRFDQALAMLASTLVPVQLSGQLTQDGQSRDGLWLLHPLQLPNGGVYQIVAVGYPQPVDIAPAPPFLMDETLPTLPGLPLSGSLWAAHNSCSKLQVYAPRLSQITRNIRWTLDLETIRRRTVDGLGELFGVKRCVVCSYDGQTNSATIAAEYHGNPGLSSWTGNIMALSQTPYLSQASASSLATCYRPTNGDDLSVLSVATRYQNQINGFILLYDDLARSWSEVELGLITDLADQVGTAITHARLFGESHALAIKLQQANASLMEKQREFQEARRQAEEARRQAEEASRLKSEFLANTSHELRTPLNGMIGFLRLVLDGMADDPQEQEEFIQEAHKSALHLLNLINDVLDIAKIEAGKMQIDMGPVNLKELLADLENFARPQAEQKGLYFNILVPATRDEITLNGNYQRLLQVLLNLVSNAVKFTHEGGITISAEVKSQRVEYQDKIWPGTVKLSVADTGIGVSLEKQDRLFQTFSQVDGERTRQYGGTGLGLAISQKLVEAMGGVVQFISMGEGLGSTVTFTALLYQEPVIIDKEPVYPSKS
jgi:signal transduction histidine kinase